MNNNKKTVYMTFSTDVLHAGHTSIINKASELGELTIGMLTDEVVASYKRFPVLKYEERVKLIESIKGVSRVIPQNTLSYANNINTLKPDYVVHGDDWKTGFQNQLEKKQLSY